jgi:hypothetical protein
MSSLFSARHRSGRVLIVGTAVAVVLTLMPAFNVVAAYAAKCPAASVGGPAVGSINAGGLDIPIKPVSYIPGGTLRPPDTAKAVGVSTLNAPLNAKRGTTVLAWHVRYGKGCFGSLNSLLKLPIGATFTVSAQDSAPRKYRITQRIEVPKGRYQEEWFAPDGPHRLALFTCGDLRYEKFHSTIAVFAVPDTKRNKK